RKREKALTPVGGALLGPFGLATQSAAGSSVDEVLELLERGRADLLRSRLGRELLLLTGEGIDALALRLGSDLLDLELEEVRDHELARATLAELLLHQLPELLEDVRHVLLRKAGLLGQLAHDLGLGHPLGSRHSSLLIRACFRVGNHGPFE